MDDIDIVPGKDAEVRFHGNRCIHSRNCVLDRPDVFVPNVEGEWIHPENATAEEIAEIAHNCPSGAIQYRRLRRRQGGSAAEGQPGARARERAVRVPRRACDRWRRERRLPPCAVPLRRLAESKPFCDARHHESGFKATGEANKGDMETLAARDGALRITATKDGPLKVEGSLEIVSGTGTTLAKTSKTFLCRCGHSSNKPFCDGTHSKVGFKS